MDRGADPDPGPQSNQRGIETARSGKGPARSGSGPQSNQRGIETNTYSFCCRPTSAGPQSNQRGIETMGAWWGCCWASSASIEPAWD